MTIDEYTDSMDGWKKEAVSALVDLVRKAVPEAAGSIKWSQPVFETEGPFCFIKAHKNHVNFGFWWGAKLDDPDGLLEGDGEKMRHIKITGLEDISADKFLQLVKQSAEMNRTLGNPTRKKA